MFTSSPSSSSSRSFRQVVKVIADFDKEVSEILEHRLLHLEIDDLIQLTEERDENWCKGVHMKTKNEGFVHTKCIKAVLTRDLDERWFHPIERVETKICLLSRKNLPNGAFLVGRSQRCDGFILSTKSSDKHVDYWKIHVKKGPEWKLHYFLKEGEWFETVEHLLNFYQNAPLPKEIGQSNILTLPVQVSTWNQEMRPDLGQLWRIKYEHLSIMKKENEGHYGEVFCGQWNQSLVAIKKPKVRSYPLTEKEKSSFAREARHLKSLNHPNIVLFYGISEYNDIPCMVTEFLENGDLRAFMKSRQEMGIYEIWSVLIQIASGMDYLETRPVPIIHRDLAARNVLIGSIVDGNPLVKISDFGLARELLDKNYYRSNECPFQWCPPETLDTGYFSRGSDMWSFGVVIYEIFTRNHHPYVKEISKVSPSTILEFLQNDGRLTRPDNCPQIFWQKIVENGCFLFEREKRPDFKECIERIFCFMDENEYEKYDRIYKNPLMGRAFFNADAEAANKQISFPEVFQIEHPRQNKRILISLDEIKVNVKDLKKPFWYGSLKNREIRGTEIVTKHRKGGKIALWEKNRMKKLVELSHSNILPFYGILQNGKHEFFVTKWLRYGTLQDFAKQIKGVNRGQVDLLIQICSGMKYLHSRGILHGHLSAANCLMGDPDLAPLVQISDYHRSYEPIGSAKDFQLRWCSIETIKTKVKTFQNDIWSFGVVIWEVFSYGATPYKGIQVNALLSSLKGGSRLERPSKCPKDIYERIMMKCFKEKPLTRPDFGNLELMLMESRKNWQDIVDGEILSDALLEVDLVHPSNLPQEEIKVFDDSDMMYVVDNSSSNVHSGKPRHLYDSVSCYNRELVSNYSAGTPLRSSSSNLTFTELSGSRLQALSRVTKSLSGIKWPRLARFRNSIRAFRGTRKEESLPRHSHACSISEDYAYPTVPQAPESKIPPPPVQTRL
ncbi:unnamed protein product, partial [Mesorhabditis belari]|uniref:Tyrosine-protein kinase n=1 Tax=Mesorhabditis belari TaxID=2138241 RepID=A0AAF3F6M0_9BILA